MSLPTVYPGELIPTTGELDILPVYPPIGTVLLKSNQVVLATACVTENTPVSLLDGMGHVVASLVIPAQETDCIVTFQGLTSVTPDSGTGVTKWATINDVPTDFVGAYIPSSLFTEGNAATIVSQGQSASVLAGTPIVVRLFLQLSVPSDVSTVTTSLNTMVVPTPLLT